MSYQKTGSPRQFIVKKSGCKYCSNNKMHYDDIKSWCTKCKKQQPLKASKAQIEKDRQHKTEITWTLANR